MSSLAFVLLYGISFGLVLCLISLGLVITMGLMRVVNMAHGAFAAIGGYLSLGLMQSYGWSYALSVPTAVVGAAALGIIVERLLIVHLYRRPELDQVLVTVGINFVVIAILTMLFGPNVLSMNLPSALKGDVDLGFRNFEVYRVVTSAICLFVISALWWAFDRTGIGAKLRAAVDNPSMAQAMGINVPMLFSATFALGCGLAALGGVLAAPILPMEPMWPLKYLVLVLVIVALAGHGQIRASVGVAMIVGIVETAGRYLFPEAGAFFIYFLLIVLMVWRQDGLFVRRRTTRIA